MNNLEILTPTNALPVLVKFFGNETPPLTEIGEDTAKFMIGSIKKQLSGKPKTFMYEGLKAIKFLQQYL